LHYLVIFVSLCIFSLSLFLSPMLNCIYFKISILNSLYFHLRFMARIRLGLGTYIRKIVSCSSSNKLRVVRPTWPIYGRPIRPAGSRRLIGLVRMERSSCAHVRAYVRLTGFTAQSGRRGESRWGWCGEINLTTSKSAASTIRSRSGGRRHL